MNTHTCLPVISQRAEYRNKDRNRFAFGCVFAKRGCLGPSRQKRKLLGLSLAVKLWLDFQLHLLSIIFQWEMSFFHNKEVFTFLNTSPTGNKDTVRSAWPWWKLVLWAGFSARGNSKGHMQNSWESHRNTPGSGQVTSVRPELPKGKIPAPAGTWDLAESCISCSAYC